MFIHQNQPLAIAVKDAGASACDVENLRIDGLTEAILDRMHRFVRLKRSVGLTLTELDKAITALGGQLDEGMLVKLSLVLELRKELKVLFVEMLSYWGPLDTAGAIEAPSLYQRLFLDQSVMNPVDRAFDPPPVSGDLAQHVPALLAAVRTDAASLALLTDGDALLSLSPVVSSALDVANLSRLHRHVSLARALGLPVAISSRSGP